MVRDHRAQELFIRDAYLLPGPSGSRLGGAPQRTRRIPGRSPERTGPCDRPRPRELLVTHPCRTRLHQSSRSRDPLRGPVLSRSSARVGRSCTVGYPRHTHGTARTARAPPYHRGSHPARCAQILASSGRCRFAFVAPELSSPSLCKPRHIVDTLRRRPCSGVPCA